MSEVSLRRELAARLAPLAILIIVVVSISAPVAYLVMGASWDGSQSMSLADKDYGFFGLESTGGSVTWVGDVNADGLSDFAVGSPYGNQFDGKTRGIVSLFIAPTE